MSSGKFSMLANLQIKNHGYSGDMETEDQPPYTVSLYLFPQSFLYLPHQNNNNKKTACFPDKCATITPL